MGKDVVPRRARWSRPHGAARPGRAGHGGPPPRAHGARRTARRGPPSGPPVRTSARGPRAEGRSSSSSGGRSPAEHTGAVPAAHAATLQPRRPHLRQAGLRALRQTTTPATASTRASSSSTGSSTGSRLREAAGHARQASMAAGPGAGGDAAPAWAGSAGHLSGPVPQPSAWQRVLGSDTQHVTPAVLRPGHRPEGLAPGGPQPAVTQKRPCQALQAVVLWTAECSVATGERDFWGWVALRFTGPGGG